MMNVPKLQLIPSAVVAADQGENLDSALTFSAEIHAELKRLINSSDFDASARNRRFLEYVVEETLAGRGERIKAYNIAIDVFGRDDSFNPQLDPVVRMEARRLRRSLERFYLSDTVGAPIQITVPKGSYVAKFENRLASECSASSPSAELFAQSETFLGPSIFISPFEVEGECQCPVRYCDGLVRQIAVGLSRFSEIGVFASLVPSAGRPPAAASGTSSITAEVDFILTGNTAVVSDKLSATASLVNARNGRVVWGETFEQCAEANGILHARDRIAERIVRSLAERCNVKGRSPWSRAKADSLASDVSARDTCPTEQKIA